MLESAMVHKRFRAAGAFWKRNPTSQHLDEGECLRHVQDVNVQELKKRLSGGFRPFAIRRTDGQEFVIPHPEFLLLGKYSVAVRDKEGFINTLDPLHIVSAPELSRRNGKS